MACLYSNMAGICNQDSNFQKSNIGSDNGLRPIRQQANAWIKDSLMTRRGNVPLGLTYWDRNKMAANFLRTFWNTFSWMEVYEFRLKYVAKRLVNNVPVAFLFFVFQIMAWHRPGDKPLSEQMMVNLQTHIYTPRRLSELNGHQRGDITSRYILIM